jgi:hypothetical protein
VCVGVGMTHGAVPKVLGWGPEWMNSTFLWLLNSAFSSDTLILLSG